MLLSHPNSVSGEDADCLLDFRHGLRQRRDAEAVLRCFCELRRRMENRHYLVFFRLRRFLENQVEVRITSPSVACPIVLPLRLDFYCLEAVRRSCLCRAAQSGMRLRKPRLTFEFRAILAGAPGKDAAIAVAP